MIGPRRHRVLLQRAVDTISDTSGAAVRTWTDIGSWHCEIRPVTTREVLAEGGVRADADVRLVGRRNSVVAALRAADRAVSVDGATFYNISGLPELSNDNKFATLRASKGMNDGS